MLFLEGYPNHKEHAMRAQAVPLFSSENPDNTWRNEIFEFLNGKLDEIILQNDMKKIEDISGAIFQNKSSQRYLKFSIQLKIALLSDRSRHSER